MTARPVDLAAPDPRRVARTARAVDAALWVVAAGVGVFSLANVHGVALAHAVADPSAWLLAPIVDVALFAGITADATLSRHGVAPSAWGGALRWFCGGATWTLNVWDAAGTGDVGAIVVHSVPPVVLILLAEAAPRYRQQFAALLTPAPTPATPGGADVAPVPAGATPPGATAPAVAPVPAPVPVPRPAPAGTGTGGGRRRGTGTGRSGRDLLAQAVATLPADDPRSDRQLAADLAPAAGLTPATARRYLAELRATAVPALTAGGTP